MSTKKKAAKTSHNRATDAGGLNEQQRRFVENIAKGMGHAEAYMAAGYKTKKFTVASANAARLLTEERIKQALANERGQNRKLAQVEREEIIGFLLQVMRTGAGKIEAESPLCQEFSETELPGEVLARKVKMPDKIRAVDRLCAMLGFNEPEEVKLKFEVVIGGTNADD